ncbi:CDP-alcohol phosphatidyltransferase family protein [Saccharicrinis sp. FJH2]|uniref:CDP-alcohol phosphatidyltransferase family protein n=1 Tax=unclassified Saccharicrinis TaxID=2646859 RepID=UPI0035D4DD98
MLRKSIPSILTMFSLLSGITALFFVFNTDFKSAMIAILVAAFFDFTDGFAARLLHATSEFGVQLDSLSDMVSFGVVPAAAATVFTASVIGLHDIDQVSLMRFIDLAVICLPLLIAVGSALRLAKFNIDKNQKSHFIGLPTPANTLFVIAFILFIKSQGAVFADNGMFLKGLLAVVFLFSAIMLVLPINLFALKFKSFRFSENWYRFLLLIAGLFALMFWGLKSFTVIIPFYIILSVILNIFSKESRLNG